MRAGQSQAGVTLQGEPQSMLTTCSESCKIFNLVYWLWDSISDSLCWSVSWLDTCDLLVHQLVFRSPFFVSSCFCLRVCLSFSLWISLYLLLLVSHLLVKTEELRICLELFWEIEEANSGHARRHRFYARLTHNCLNTYFVSGCGSGSVPSIVNGTMMQGCSLCHLGTLPHA